MLDTSSFYKPTEPGAYPIVLGHLRDRLLEVRGRRGRHGGQGVPDSRHSSDGQKGLADNGYIPIPDAFKAELTTAINAIS